MAKKKAKGKMVVSLDELSQDIDLKQYLGRKPTDSEKRNFSESAIDLIENRTLDGDDINGKEFKKYSPKYAESKGVTVDSVDLFLEGKMLESIGRRKSKEKTSSVFIQMKKGKETKKAFNHNTGDTLKQREFFGLTDLEAKAIAREIKETQEDNRISKQKRDSDRILRQSLSLLDLEQTS